MGEGGIFNACIDRVLAMCASFMGGTGAHVSIGGSNVLKPREMVVRELPESVTFSDVSTSRLGASGARGCYRVTFNVAVDCWSQSRDLREASATVNQWAHMLSAHVAADKTLGGLCIHAQPYVANGGTSYDTAQRLFTAALRMGVTVNADIDPAKEVTSQNGD